MFRFGALCALCHAEKFPLGQNRYAKRPRFVELASGLFAADEVIGVFGYGTSRFGPERFDLRVGSVTGEACQLPSDDYRFPGKYVAPGFCRCV
jgi:hypothetical protein